MKSGNTTNVGIFELTAFLVPIMYAKYASVNVKMLTLRGNFEIGPVLERANESQIWFKLPSFKNGSSGSADPIDMVIKQFNSNIAINMIPLISELNIADNPKKLINMNGANRNPMYIMDFMLSASTMVDEL